MFERHSKSAITVAALMMVAGWIPAGVHALGLGRLEVDSNLGEPLRLVIDVNSVTAAEAESLEIALASRSDFSRAGVEYPYLAGLLNFELTPLDGGNYQVVITTQDAVNETYLHLLVSATWSGGKAVREYTALLDPPLYSGRPAAPVETVAQPDTEPDTAGVSGFDSLPTRSADAIDGPGLGTDAAADSVVVQRGDTLSHIIERLNVPADLNRFQAYLAVFRANPGAFIENNMNLLRNGAVLNIPSFSEMEAVSRSESLSTFNEQLASFTAYQNRVRQQQETQSGETLDRLIAESEAPVEPVAPASRAVETVTGDESEAAVAEAEPAPEAEPAAAEPEVAEPRLTIGQEPAAEPGPGAGNQEQLEALRAQLAELDESLLASGVESQSVRQNLEQIQQQVERISTLVEVEDAPLAAAQSRAMDADDAPAMEPEAMESEPMAAADPPADDVIAEVARSLNAAGQGAQEEVAAVDPEGSVENELSTESDDILLAQQDVPQDGGSDGTAMDSGDGSASLDAPADDGAAGDTGSAAGETAETTQAPARAVPETDAATDGDNRSSGPVRKVAESSLLDNFKGIFSSLPDYALKIAAGLLGLLLVLFLWQRRKSRKEFDASMLDIETEEVSMNSETSIQRMSDASGIDLASANDSALELTIGGGMSYLSEEGITGVNEEDNEVIKAGAVDPLAEADVYLAYDRDEQAVQVLKEAYAETPERGELAEKLLEIYHKQDDRRAFDSLAEELHRRTDTTRNVNWERVIAMGREVSPDNSLYTGDAPKAPETNQSNTLDLDDDLLDELPSGQINFAETQAGITPESILEDPVSELEVDDLDLGGDDGTAAKPETDVDAPTLSQIITSEVEEKLSPEVNEEEEISLTDNEIALNLGGDDHEFDLIEAESKRAMPDDGEASEAPEAMAAAVSLDDDSSMSELSDASLGKLEPYHESETALELAKAYMELGEQEIAKGFIEEVLNEGSEKQKQKARTMIKDLAT